VSRHADGLLPGATPTATEADRLARVVLSRAIEPGDRNTSSLVRQLGAPGAVREQLAPKADSGLPERLREVDPARELEQAERCGIRFVVPGDPEWPPGLDDLDQVDDVQELGGTPPGLWVKGPMPLTELASSVAVVGSRSCSVYGEEVTRGMASVVAGAGVPVVSGGAKGVDFAAHDAALLAGGATVAVLACGVDRVYPQVNSRLLAHLATEFAVVSEQPPGSSPTRIRFLARNRLIAALTRGTVLVEAALRSGALNTAGWAEQLSRSVMCVPGPVTSYTSQGVHLWIRRGGSTVVTHGTEVLECIGVSGRHLVQEPRGEERLRDTLTRADQLVLEAVPVSSPASVASIARLCARHVRDTNAALHRLERDGFVRLVEGGWRLAGAG
jgi:DNA processing protein